MTRRRVLVDLTSGFRSVRPGGVSRFVVELAHGLVEAHDSWKDDLDILGVGDLDPLRVPKLNRDLVGAVEYPLRDTLRLEPKDLAMRRRVTLTRALYREPMDLLHLPDPLGTPLSPTPRIVTCHELFSVHYPAGASSKEPAPLWKRAHVQKRFRSAKRVVAVSRQTRDALVSLLGVTEAKVDVIPVGVDLTRYSPTPDKMDDRRLRRLGVEEPFVLVVGRSDWRKNTELMLKAVGRARKEVPLELACAGFVDDRVRGKLHDAAMSAGLGEAARVLDLVNDDELGTLYRRASALLCVSRDEGFGLPVLEAMASGCPVIVTKGSNMEDIAGPAGIAVAHDDVEGISAAVVKLVRDTDLRRSLGKNARERAAVYARKLVAERYVVSYKRALGI